MFIFQQKIIDPLRCSRRPCFSVKPLLSQWLSPRTQLIFQINLDFLLMEKHTSILVRPDCNGRKSDNKADSTITTFIKLNS